MPQFLGRFSFAHFCGTVPMVT